MISEVSKKALSKVKYVPSSNDLFPSIFQIKLTVYQHFNKMARRQNGATFEQACLENKHDSKIGTS